MSSTKKQIVKSISNDVGGSGDAIYHIIRASKSDKTVEIEMCYQCLRYEIEGASGEFSGELSSTSSENTLNKLLFE